MAASIGDLLEERLREQPGAIALTADGVGWTWTALAARARQIARALVASGVGPQERIVYVGKNSAELVQVLLGAAVANVIFVPLNWRLSPAELVQSIGDTRATVLVVDAELAEVAARFRGELPRLRTAICTGSAAGWTSLETWVGHEPTTAFSVPAGARDVAVQMYTSGTTGQPKGAMFANGSNVRVLTEDISRAWDLRADDVSLLVMPLFHMGGLAWALAGLARGARLVVVRDFEPSAVLELCARERVTVAFFVPVMLRALLAVPDRERHALVLRRLVYSGSPIAPSTLRQAMTAFACGFVQIYGMTEATGAFAQLEPDEHDPGGPRERLLTSAGRAYPWVDVRVVDLVTGEEAAPGQPGEIWCRSVQTMVGYFARPEETAQALTGDGWLRTGDVGTRDAEGYLFLLDRKKELIITGGENVYPAEVEGVLTAHPDLAEVAVFGVPSEKWGETVKAAVVARPGHTVTAESVIAFARERLAAFKCPTSVDIAPALPRTATGKITKNVLRDPYWAGFSRRIN